MTTVVLTNTTLFNGKEEVFFLGVGDTAADTVALLYGVCQ